MKNETVFTTLFGITCCFVSAWHEISPSKWKTMARTAFTSNQEDIRICDSNLEELFARTCTLRQIYFGWWNQGRWAGSVCENIQERIASSLLLHVVTLVSGKQFVKFKVARLHATKIYRESRGTAPVIPNLGTRWRWMCSLRPRPLYRLKGASDAHWIGGWVGPSAVLEKKNFESAGNDSRTIQLVARLLYLLRYFSFCTSCDDL
jgi:hypothetical protein